MTDIVPTHCDQTLAILHPRAILHFAAARCQVLFCESSYDADHRPQRHRGDDATVRRLLRAASWQNQALPLLLAGTLSAAAPASPSSAAA